MAGCGGRYGRYGGRAPPDGDPGLRAGDRGSDGRQQGVALMILAAGTDLLEAGLAAAQGSPDGGHSVTPWLQPATVLPLCLAAVLWPALRQPAWGQPRLRISVPAGPR